MAQQQDNAPIPDDDPGTQKHGIDPLTDDGPGKHTQTAPAPCKIRPGNQDNGIGP